MSDTTTTPNVISHPDCDFCNWNELKEAASGLGVELRVERHHGVSYWDELIVTRDGKTIWKAIDPFKPLSLQCAVAFLRGIRTVSEPDHTSAGPTEQAAVAGETVVYLLERGQALQQSPTMWWLGPGEYDFTETAYLARAFTTREEAQAQASRFEGIGIRRYPFALVTEHIFLTPHGGASAPSEASTMSPTQQASVEWNSAIDVAVLNQAARDHAIAEAAREEWASGASTFARGKLRSLLEQETQ